MLVEEKKGKFIFEKLFPLGPWYDRKSKELFKFLTQVEGIKDSRG